MEKVETKKNNIILPALRGHMGDWVYYVCLMRLPEIASRIRFVEEIHTNKNLSDMIQRTLQKSRENHIAEYIKTSKERFFNSIVVATYGGKPGWSEIDELSGKGFKEFSDKLSEDALNSLGFLTLTGEERLFTIDGQHRLSGVKKTALELSKEPPDEEITPMDDALSVIFVAHEQTPEGRERTRRLFTTLNKTARPVSKGDIIALDEDDAMAITTRKLIEETTMFSDERTAFVAGNNIPSRNKESLITIGALYDVLEILFSAPNYVGAEMAKDDLKRVRPSDEDLATYFEFAKGYFVNMAKQFQPLSEFFDSAEYWKVVSKFRGGKHGNMLFRPIGQKVLANVFVRLAKNHSADSAFNLCGKLPTLLDEPPYRDLMWIPSSQRITNSHPATLRDAMLYMLDEFPGSEDKLLERYRRDVDDRNAKLPRKVVSHK